MRNYEKAIIELYAEYGYVVTLEAQTVKKTNKEKEVLLVCGVGENRPVLYVDELEEAERHYSSYEELKDEMRSLVENCVRGLQAVTENPYYQEKDYILENVFLTAVNTEMNKEYIEKYISRDIFDLTLLYRVPLKNDENCYSSYLLPKSFFEGYGFSEEELFERAVSNSSKKVSVKKVVPNLFGPCTEDVTDEELRYNLLKVGYEDGIRGAGVIALTDVFKELSDKCDTDMIILPSSVDELLAVSYTDDMNAGQYLQMVEEVNNNVLEAEELLSYNIYIYRRETGTIEMIENC